MKATIKSLALASAIALVASASFAEVTLRLAHAAPESDLQQVMSLYVKEQVEARTDGEVKINIFPQGQLGNDAQMIDGARSGIIDFVMVGLNNFGGLMPETGAFELPFMFPDRETAYKVLDGDVGQGVLDDMAAHGLKGLGHPENGYRNITNSRGPIREPGDLAGLQMRVNNSRALGDMFSLLGANPQQLPIAELYTALETGVVNSQDHPIGVTLSFKYDEVQDYLSLTQHAYASLVLAMNLNSFNNLTPEQQTILTEVVGDAVAMQRQMSIDMEDEMIAELESRGMEVNRDVNSAAFQEAIAPVWTTFIETNGDELVNAILAASE